VRDPEGAETLEAEPTAAALQAVREAVPGVPVGLTSGLWIAGDDPDLRLSLIQAWTVRPDFVSVNLSEPGADELVDALLAEGVAIEAGLWSVENVETLASSRFAGKLLRALIEPQLESAEESVALAASIDAALDEAGIQAPRLHHGYGLPTWSVIDAALALGRDVRIGLEDTTVMRDGSPAPDNAAMVAEVAAIA
jgi:uncharacterized protein (DUF849 family)